jgi:hypothetical protein
MNLLLRRRLPRDVSRAILHAARALQLSPDDRTVLVLIVLYTLLSSPLRQHSRYVISHTESLLSQQLARLLYICKTC